MTPGKVPKRSTRRGTTQDVANNSQSQQDGKKRGHNRFQKPRAENPFRNEQLQTLLRVSGTRSKAGSLNMLVSHHSGLPKLSKEEQNCFPGDH